MLLKSAGPDGFVFFTNYDSRKGAEIAASSAVALHFGWYPLHRQVRVEGTAERVSRSESVAYFATRPRGSQLGAWASAQSTEVATLEELTASYAAAEQRFAGAGRALPRALGRISGDAEHDRVLAGPAQPDARSPGLPAQRFRLVADPAGALIPAARPNCRRTHSRPTFPVAAPQLRGRRRKSGA